MKIADLIKNLQALDPEMDVYLSSDSEGNHTLALSEDASIGFMSDDGDFFEESWSSEDADLDEEDWEEMKTRPKVIVLWPY